MYEQNTIAVVVKGKLKKANLEFQGYKLNYKFEYCVRFNKQQLLDAIVNNKDSDYLWKMCKGHDLENNGLPATVLEIIERSKSWSGEYILSDRLIECSRKQLLKDMCK